MLAHLKIYISGNSCPQPGNIPHGNWSCQMQEIPIPDATFLDGDANTYPGEWSKASSKFTFKWHFLSALQCRLDCNPGYVAHKTPIITCVNGEYQPQARLWQESQPQKVFLTQTVKFLKNCQNINVYCPILASTAFNQIWLLSWHIKIVLGRRPVR